MAISRPIVGVDLGGTNMQIGVVAPDGRIIGRSKKKTRAEEGSTAVIGRITAGIEEAVAEAKLTMRAVAGIGIGTPGAVDAGTGVVREAPNLRWRDVPLAKLVTRRLGRECFLDNDVRSAAWGEHAFGAGKGASDMLAVWIGTGIGGGLILHNRLYHGVTNTAGEIGHVTLLPGSPPGSRSLENNCSRTAIADRLVRLIKTNHASMIPELTGNDLTEVKARVIAQAYVKGDKLTRQVVDNAAWMLGVGIASAVTLLGLQRVVIGGGLTEAMGETLVALVRESVRTHAFPEIVKRVEVLGTKLQADAGVVGAAMLAGERLGRGRAASKPKARSMTKAAGSAKKSPRS